MREKNLLLKSLNVLVALAMMLAMVPMGGAVAEDLGTDLQFVVANTNIEGILAYFQATFPDEIPQSVLDAGYYINSRITLSEALPGGTIVKVVKDETVIYNDTFPSGVTVFWFTDLIGGASPTAFDDRYNSLVETYEITVSGNPEAVGIQITIESILSQNFSADPLELVVLAEKTLFIDEAIESVSVSIPAPVNGEEPVNSAEILSLTEGILSALVTWEPSAITFVYETVYTATLELTPNEGYTFTVSTAVVLNEVTVPEDDVTLNLDGTLTVIKVFPPADVAQIESVAITVAAPVAGGIPAETAGVVTVPVGAATVTSVDWDPDHTTFAYNTAYTVIVVLTAATGYDFTGTTAATINGVTAIVDAQTANTLTVSYEFPATDTAITNAAITVTAPVAGGIPAETAGVVTVPVGAATVTSVDWDPDHTTFAYNTAYTVTVVLTAATGYDFTGTTAATINGVTAIVDAQTANTLTVSYKFPVTDTAITSVSVTGVSTPVAGGTPNFAASVSAIPTGSLTATTAEISWEGEFTADGKFAYYTVYTASVNLTAEEGYTFTDETTAKLNTFDADVNLEDGTLTVSYTFPRTEPEPITSLAISDITPPEAGDEPDFQASVVSVPEASIEATIATVLWDLTEDTFAYYTAYTATVELAVKEGYVYISGTTNITVNGQAPTEVNFLDGTLTVSYTFPKTEPEPISSVTITEIEAPVALNMPDDQAMVDSDPDPAIVDETAEVVWEDEFGNPFTGVFVYNTRYTAVVVLAVVEGYTYVDGENGTTVTLNGQTPTEVTFINATLTVRYQFDPADSASIANVELTLPGPVAGQSPVAEAEIVDPETGIFSAEVTWDPENDPFVDGVEYTATIELVAEVGYAFSDTTSVTLNDELLTTDEVTYNDDGTITVVYKFPPAGAFTLQITVSPVDSGNTVIKDPNQPSYAFGDVVKLTPNPATGFAFLEWEGPNADELIEVEDGTWSIEIDEDKSLIANFVAVPIAVDDQYETAINERLNVPAPGVLGNDEPPNGVEPSELTMKLETNVGVGTLFLPPELDGRFVYDPLVDWVGETTFTYRACYQATDGFFCSEPATVTIAVKTVPVAEDDDYETAVNVPLEVDAPGVLGNDMGDGDLTAVLETDLAPGEGELFLDENGGFDYIPEEDWTGVATFTYLACDGEICSDPATVTIAVKTVPTAVNDFYETAEDTPLNVTAPGVLDNDLGDGVLKAVREPGLEPEEGELILEEDGGFVYTPPENWTGVTSFTYRACDGEICSEPATVTITVRTMPIAGDDYYETAVGEKLDVDAPGVLGNDSGEGDLIAVLKDKLDPNVGLLTLNEDGSFEYIPPVGEAVTVTFTYLACDGEVCSDPATVTIAVKTIPTAVNDFYEIAVGTPLNVSAPGVLGNDSGDGILEAELMSGLAAGTGSLTLNSNGGFTYQPPAGWKGTASFTYRACDGSICSAEATVSIAVKTVPTALDDQYQMPINSTLDVPAPGVLDNDSGDDDLEAELVSGLAAGTGSLTFYESGRFTYLPPTGWTGTASFTYKACDGTICSSPATVTIAVKKVPTAAPYLYKMGLSTSMSVPKESGVLRNHSGDPVWRAEEVTKPAVGELILIEDGSFTYTQPVENWPGSTTFTYRACDGEICSAPATVTIEEAVSCLVIASDPLVKRLQPDTTGTQDLILSNTCDVPVNVDVFESGGVVGTPVLSEGFESVPNLKLPPSGWDLEVLRTDRTWFLTDADEYVDEGQYAAWVNYAQQGKESDEWLISSIIDTTGLDDLVLTFRANSETVDKGATLRVWVTDVNGDPITEFSEDPLWDMIRDEVWVTRMFRTVQVDLGQFDDYGQIRIAWQYVSLPGLTKGETFGLDDIKVGARSDLSWLSLAIARADFPETIPAQSELEISVTFDAAGLDAGMYEGMLFVRNAPYRMMNVPVLLEVRVGTIEIFLPLINK